MIRNPLADPGALDISAGVILLVVTMTAASDVATRTSTLGASLIGAVVAAGLIFAISGSGGGSRSRLALVGIAASAAFASLTQAVLVTNQLVFSEFRYWAPGPLESVDMGPVAVAGAVIACDGMVTALISSVLGVLAIGEDTVVDLGVRVCLIRSLGVVAVTALAGEATAFGGPLIFMGLAVPLLVRYVAGARQGAITLWSLIVGVVWVCAADIVSRLVPAPSEAPVGVIAALIGVPSSIIGSRRKGTS